MNDQKTQRHALSHYLEKRQSEGYSLVKAAVMPLLGYSEKSFQRAAGRLIRQKSLLSIKPGFFIIVPSEYQASANLPPEYFINDLMRYLEIPYYIGLRSAAALYGADTFDQPCQVMIPRALSQVNKDTIHIRFLKNKKTTETPFNVLNTERGMLRVSTPEATAFDLVKFYKSSGYFKQVTPVISGLRAQLKPDTLVETAKKGLYEWPIIQRLGYFLSLAGASGEALTEPLAEWISSEKPRYIPLVPDKAYKETEKNLRWRIFVNESIEADR